MLKFLHFSLLRSRRTVQFSLPVRAASNKGIITQIPVHGDFFVCLVNGDNTEQLFDNAISNVAREFRVTEKSVKLRGVMLDEEGTFLDLAASSRLSVRELYSRRAKIMVEQPNGISTFGMIHELSLEMKALQAADVFKTHQISALQAADVFKTHKISALEAADVLKTHQISALEAELQGVVMATVHPISIRELLNLNLHLIWSKDPNSPRGLGNVAAHEVSVKQQVAAVKAYAGRKEHFSLLRILRFVHGIQGDNDKY
ncbi:hypothetical protein CEUSTIGMA_g6138.t1 [Chlamydomonas eustigma]|uniref:Uncharacterized protein n=1 Tax=Chlamydomonas eustigma TaxID=1157962 RepID=A0A250X7G5_9CHLO|nr:hypothetical protein CEUSTIGMA_g6138.t1 [Chlamydomonas eustigma]|eukprot:GAX78700.1 hypothetical protein CEUSTIGMA_g6138.t1 [Chlamydomonas eustigma]